jgi:hypothetical protein
MAALDKNRSLIRLSESTRTDFGRVNFSDQGDAQKVFSSIWELESQVNNGGFDAYLRNSDADAIAYAPTALRNVGANQCAAIVDRALQLLDPLPSTRDAREDALDALDSEAFEALDAEFLGYPDDLTDLLFAFVSTRPETFGIMS